MSARATRARAGALLLLATASLPGCALLRDRPAAVARQAESLAARGEIERAYEEVHAEVLRSGGDFRLLFLEGWLSSQRAASRSGPEREALFLEAVRSYERALALLPGQPETLKNLALVHARLASDARGDARAAGHLSAAVERAGQVAALDARDQVHYDSLLIQGDAWRDPAFPAAPGEDPVRAALAAYRAAHELARQRTADELPPFTHADAAATKALELCARQLRRSRAVEWAEETFALSEELERDGLPDLAIRGYRALVAVGNPRSDEALLGWVAGRSRRGTLDVTTLAELGEEACPAVRPALDELTALLAEPAGFTLEGDRAVPPVPWDLWSPTPGDDPTSLARVHVLALALQSLAERQLDGYAIDGDPAHLEKARDVLRSARIVAPSWDDYGDAHPELQGRADVGLDVAIDLASLFHMHRDLLPEARANLRELLETEPLSSFSRQSLGDPEGAVDRVRGLGRQTREVHKVHTLLGLIYADLYGWKSRAQYHLEAAAEALEEGDELTAVLSTWIAEGLSDLEPLDGPVDAYLDAGETYSALGAPYAVRELYRPARDVARRTRRHMLDLEYLVYPDRGFYLGGGVGYADGGESESTLENDLAGLGVDAEFELDDTDLDLRIFGGYRFGPYLALEGALVSLGNQESSVRVLSGGIDSKLLDDVQRHHPLTGRGISFAGLFYPRGQPRSFRRVNPFLKAGLWAWDADFDVAVESEEVNINESGLDPFFGVGLHVRVAPRWDLRAEYEYYRLGNDDYEMIFVGFQVRPF